MVRTTRAPSGRRERSVCVVTPAAIETKSGLFSAAPALEAPPKTGHARSDATTAGKTCGFTARITTSGVSEIRLPSSTHKTPYVSSRYARRCAPGLATSKHVASSAHAGCSCERMRPAIMASPILPPPIRAIFLTASPDMSMLQNTLILQILQFGSGKRIAHANGENLVPHAINACIESARNAKREVQDAL